MSGAGYGSHPTLYGSLGDLELYSLYRGESWSNLDEFHRQQLLQETVNRAARENGEKGSCRVVFVDMEPRVAGKQSGDTICLNRGMYVFDRRNVTYKGQEFTVPFPASNLHALTTVLHEDIHAFQAQIINGEIETPDLALKQEYTANNFTVIPLSREGGTVKYGSTYLTGSDSRAGYYLYYFQSTERDAYRFSETKTASIMEVLAEKYGDEPSFVAYRAELQENGYQATLAQAQELFGHPSPEKEISQALMNAYYGGSTPVAPWIETIVREEMVVSYEALHGPLSVQPLENRNEQEVNTMSIPSHVSAEEYNQTLRDSVNAYYEHAINSPEMSQEEAIQSTAQMAEAYLSAVEEFEAAETAEAGLDDGGLDSGSLDDGGLDDGGLDDGGLDDGGIE